MTDLTTRQGELEYESVLLGKHRYDTARKRGESATKPGKFQTEATLPILSKAINEFVEKAANQAGERHTALGYLLHILPEQAAYLTIRYAIDAAAVNQKINTVALNLGSAVEDHVELLRLNEAAPGLYRKVMEQVRKATTARHRSGVLRHVIDKYLADTLEWSDRDKVRLGVKLIELFDDSCKVVTLRRDTEGRHNTPVKLVFTDEAQEWFDRAHGAASKWAPVHLPMIVPPVDWSSALIQVEEPQEDGTTKSIERINITGGYLTGALRRRASLIQQRLPGAAQRIASGDLSAVFAAVNAVQRTPWRINRQLLAVMREARTYGRRYEALFVEPDNDMPVRPDFDQHLEPASMTIDQREEFTRWKRDAARVYDFNARQKSKRSGVSQKLEMANKYVDEEAIYFPHYLDFRGRMYPFASYLNPQSSDCGRALLEFAEGKRLGEHGLYWLKVHIANLFGIDKVPFADRVKWVNDNMERLLRYATAPMDDLSWAEGKDTRADAPWCAVAACMELAGALVQGSDFVSHLPIAMDGSCSGLQHYSAMLRDPVGGAAVNLVPDDKPGDIYTQVAKRAQNLSDASTNGMADSWRGKVVRKVAKQPTMTLCYSATVFGMQGQIAKAVIDLGGSDYLGGADIKPASVYLAQIVWDAIGDVVVAARTAMDFLKDCSVLASEAYIPVCWATPSGFRVEQGYVKMECPRLKLHYKGERIRLTLAVDTKVLDPKKQSAGIAPNFVHSLDSAHLMATVNLGVYNGLNHWACIHDSFGTHAADVDTLHACIREAFIEQYTPNVLENFREEIVSQLPPELAEKVPPVPRQGTLDLAAVRESQYFFA